MAPISSPKDRRESTLIERGAAQERSVFVPRKTRMRYDEWAGLLASGSAYSPHLPARLARDAGRDLRRAVVFAAFVPGYSGGTATDLHRLPYSSPGPQARDDTNVGGHHNAREKVVNRDRHTRGAAAVDKQSVAPRSPQ